MSSPRDRERKEILLKFYREHHRLPAYDEMALLFGLRSKGSLHKYIQHFIDDGLLAKSETGKLIPTIKLYGLRVLGTIQAGFPTAAEEELLPTMSLDQFLIDNPSSTFVISVAGDSMIEAGIMAGDRVMVDRSKAPLNGDIVVAEVDHEWTLKYLIKEKRESFLRAANKNYPDIHPEEELKIGGVVVAAVRKY